MLDIETYVLARQAAKKYTDETAIQFGGLKGAPCKVKSIVKEENRSIVTFEWENDEGETRESQMVVEDGTPIYVWTPGISYKYGDLVIYQSCFYRCITPNSDLVFDDRKWNEIGSPDGNYDIVQNESMLPVRFTPADRKMYYAIEEDCFFFWDGYQWTRKFDDLQKKTLDEPIIINGEEYDNLEEALQAMGEMFIWQEDETP